MKAFAHFGCTAALLALAGCAATNTMSVPEPCSAGNGALCVVTVTVKDCDHISAKPDRAMVAQGNPGDVDWVLDAPAGWDFASDGIVFKDANNPEFGNRRPGKKDFKWKFNNGKKAEHRYWIHVTDGYKTCSHDPSIMN
jgi:hypothetical protein